MPRQAPARPRRARLLAAAAAVTAASVLAAGCSLFSSEPEDATPAERGPGIVVAVDGWSLKMMPSSLRWELGGRKGEVVLEPATEAEIDELLERDPNVVTQLAARLLTADPRLTCDTDGCTAGGEKVDLAGLSDVAAGPYGHILEAAGVTSAVHVGFVPVEGAAVVHLDAGSDRVVVPVGAVGAEDAPLPPGTPDPESFEWYDEYLEAAESGQVGVEGDAPIADAPAADDPLFEGDPGNPESVDRSSHRTVVLAAGAGRMFEPVAPWLTGEENEGLHPFGATDLSALLAPALGELEVPDGDGPLAAGLAAADPSVTADLSASQLSALTAPTTGCGVAVVCAPDGDGVEIETHSVDTARVCDSEIVNPFVGSPEAGEPEPQPAVLQMVTRSQSWTVSGGPRNQFGFWETDPTPPNLLFWPGAAPSVEGDVSRHVRTVELYDGEGRLVNLFGEVTDDAADWGVDHVIGAHSDRFTRCDEPPVFELPGTGDTIEYGEIPEFLDPEATPDP